MPAHNRRRTPRIKKCHSHTNWRSGGKVTNGHMRTDGNNIINSQTQSRSILTQGYGRSGNGNDVEDVTSGGSIKDMNIMKAIIVASRICWKPYVCTTDRGHCAL